MSKKLNILFVCTENSCRSIMFEAILNDYAKSNFHAYSAGAKPKGSINPYALKILNNYNIEVGNLYSKSITEIECLDQVKIDLIITVCSKASKNSCPILFKKVPQIHFDINDPSKLNLMEDKLLKKFKELFLLIKSLVIKINNIKIDNLSNLEIAQKIQQLYK